MADLTVDAVVDTLMSATDQAGLRTACGLGTAAVEAVATLQDIVNDTTPQLGGSLDVNAQKIVSVSNGNIDIEPHGTGNVLVGNFTFDADQTVGVGQDNYVLTYDDGTGLVSLEAAGAGSGDVSKVGTPVNDQVGVWTGDGTLEGTSSLTFSSAGYLLVTGSQEINTATTTSVGLIVQTTDDNLTKNLVEFQNMGGTKGVWATAGLQLHADHGCGAASTLFVGGGGNASVSGTSNVAMGNLAGSALTSGANNFAMGASAMRYNATGSSNCCIGTNAGAGVTGNSNTDNTFIGTNAGLLITTGIRSVGIGSSALDSVSSSEGNIGIGYQAGNTISTGAKNIVVGSGAGSTLATGSGNVIIGAACDVTSSAVTGGMAIGYNAQAGANDMVFGGASYSWTNAYFGKNATNASPAAFTINATGGSGTNIAGADMSIAGGRSTGSGTPGKVLLKAAIADGASTTLNDLVTVLECSANTTAMTLGFFGATAVIKQAGTGEATGFVAGSGTAVNDDSTFTGNVGSTAYRINDIVKALKNYGLLAS